MYKLMKRHMLKAIIPGLFSLGLATLPAAAQSQEIQLTTDIAAFGGQGGTKEIKVTQGKNFIIFNHCDWMKYDFKDNTFRITVTPYNSFIPRKTSIVLTSKKTNSSKVLQITQRADNNRPEMITKPQGSNLVFLDEMNLDKCPVYFIKNILKNKSVDNKDIQLKGSRYESAVETHAPSTLTFRTNGATRFQAETGIDDEIVLRNAPDHYGNVQVDISVDGKVVKKGHLLMKDMDVMPIDVDLKGSKYFQIKYYSDNTEGDHVAIGNGRFEYSGTRPEVVTEEEMIQGLKAPEKTFASPTSNPQCKGDSPTCKDKKQCCKEKGTVCKNKTKATAKKKPAKARKKTTRK